eukprot:CAMPEP_0179918542 /NCGR_PEP_ID=MMETSP0983-20121128/3445_1 /TAXON_ID=483367 /ORGANISM="non described non described, Strain CCMP 2436" /LENGTH=92 /DNA_ID=CAMNT_0021821397 /DNA_START=490 /DNA_END=769 /DNA_ORIENTATION=-
MAVIRRGQPLRRGCAAGRCAPHARRPLAAKKRATARSAVAGLARGARRVAAGARGAIIPGDLSTAPHRALGSSGPWWRASCERIVASGGMRW